MGLQWSPRAATAPKEWGTLWVLHSFCFGVGKLKDYKQHVIVSFGYSWGMEELFNDLFCLRKVLVPYIVLYPFKH